MSLVDEIAVKIGADPTALKAALADSDAAIRGFGQAGEKSVGGLFNSMEERLTSYRNLSTAVFTALGLNFEKLGQDAARWLTGMDVATEESYKKLDESNTTTTDKLIALKAQILAASHANWTEEDKLNQLLQARDLIDQHMADNQGLNYQSEKMRNEQKIQWNSLIIQSAQNELAIAQANAAIDKARTAEWDLQIKSAIAIGEEERKTYEASLSANNQEYGFNLRILDLKQNIAIAQSVLASGALDEKNTAQWINKLAAEKKDLVVAEAVAEKEHLTIMFSLFDAQTKITNEAGKSEALYEAIQLGDGNRVQTLKLQTQEKLNQAEIDHLLRNGIDMLNPKEIDRLNLLIGQNKVIDAQVASLKIILMNLDDQVKTIQAMPINEQANAYDVLIKKTQALHDSTVIQLGTENDVTAQMVAQINALQMQRNEISDIASALEGMKLNAQGGSSDSTLSQVINGKMISGVALSDQYIQQQSSDALIGIIKQKQADAAAVQSNPNNSDLASQASGNFTEGWMLAGINTSIAAAQQELALRSQVQQYAAMHGQGAAIQQYGDSTVNRAMSSTATATQNTAANVAAIANTLNQVFPGQATPVVATHG